MLGAYIAFEPVILSQASDDLLAEYGELVEHRGIIGYDVLLPCILYSHKRDY